MKTTKFCIAFFCKSHHDTFNSSVALMKPYEQAESPHNKKSTILIFGLKPLNLYISNNSNDIITAMFCSPSKEVCFFRHNFTYVYFTCDFIIVR